MPVDLQEGLVAYAFGQQSVYKASCSVSAMHVQLACKSLSLTVSHPVCGHQVRTQTLTVAPLRYN